MTLAAGGPTPALALAAGLFVAELIERSSVVN